MKSFLGYPSEHLSVARDIWAFLKGLDVDVWFDKERLIGGQHWQPAREQAQDEADLILHILADEMSHRSGDVHSEIARSLKRALDMPPQSLFILPILVNGAKIPRELARYQYLEHARDDFKFRLAQSVAHRFDQLALPAPEKLTRYVNSTLEESGKTEHRLVSTSETVELQGSYFQYQMKSPYYDFVNAVIAYNTLKGYHEWKCDNDEEVFDHPSSWESNAVEHFRQGEIISLMFVYAYYHTGAAHGNFGIYTENFGGQKLGRLSLRSVFEPAGEHFKFLLKYVQLDLTKQIYVAGIDEPYFLADFTSMENDEESAWRFLANFNFDQAGIVFHFNPYDVFPYVFGAFAVKISWGELEGRTSERFSPLIVGLNSASN